jgi:4,5-DOPA dioxygenase extradiol
MNNLKMPVLFIGHGSPMNVILENDFTNNLKNLAAQLPNPEAIMVISAHWLTSGTYVTCMKNPEQIYDFYGFPKELYDIKYNCKGSPASALLTIDLVKNEKILCSTEWGLDHASWSILKHVYPKADIPVYELSLDLEMPVEFHYHMGKELRKLREKGILIIGSGNIVHNLNLIDYNMNSKPENWVIDVDERIKECLVNKKHDALIDYKTLDKNSIKAIPTLDHFLPMIYILGIQEESDNLKFIHEGYQNKTISMRSYILTEK